MDTTTRRTRRGATLVTAIALGIAGAGAARDARADDATVSVGRRFAPPPERVQPAPIAAGALDPEDPEESSRRHDRPELRRAPFRLQLGPSTVTTGKGFGLGVGAAADFGTGSVGGRLSAGWIRGEGRNADGTSTPTGDLFGTYGGELTLDFLKRGPLHPVLGMGVALLHVSRPDANSGFAGAGTARLGLEVALGLEDADVRLGASATAGLVGPVDDEIKELRGYALLGAHLALGF